MAARPTNRWDRDSDDSDQGSFTAQPPSPVRNGNARTAWQQSRIRSSSSAQGTATDRSPKSPVPYSDVETVTRRGAERENRVVLGLDYGTTATGLAWMHQKTTSEPKFEDVQPFTTWRDGGGNPKVASQISYSKGSNTDGAEQHKLILHWTKLELEARRPVLELQSLRDALDGLRVLQSFRSADNPELTHDIPRHLSKTPTDIVKDFLLTVARQYYTHMNKNPSANALAKGPGGVPLDIVVTHPAEWDYGAVNKLYRAMTDAFHKQMFPTRRNVFFVSEPEACALFTVQQLISTGENNLIPGDCFVICDAGGGTVDLVTYKIESVSPLEISRVAAVTGANCGATFIDRAFIRWLKSMSTNLNIGDDDVGSGGHFLLTPERKAMLNRFEPLKRQFTGEEDNNTITIPSGVIMKPNTPNYRNGLLTIRAADMRRFFEESVNGTIKLIARQVEGATAQGEQVKTIFMSGGLSQSEYLFRRIEDWARNDPGEIEVKRPTECWTAVAQGAVLRGTGLGSVSPKAAGECPRHYGIAASERWSSCRHTDRQALSTDKAHGHRIATEQITWLVRKGDVIIPGKPVEVRQRVTCWFRSGGPDRGSVAKIKFCSTTLKAPPTSLTKLPADSNEISTLDVKLEDIPASCRRSGDSSRASNFMVMIDVLMRVGYNDGRGVLVQALCEGREVAQYRTHL